MNHFVFKQFLHCCIFFSLFLTFGCTPFIVVLGVGGATAAYKVATDKRTVGTQVDDSTITARVKTALIDDPSVYANTIDVDTLEGVVVLRGTVETEQESEKAANIARGIANVGEVKNRLMIGSKAFGESINDGITASKIKSKLLVEPGIKFLNIDVDVNKGIVSLSGIVGSMVEMEKICNIARSTRGTVKVVNNIIVRN